MQIQVNTGHHIANNETLTAEITQSVSDGLQRFSGRITRVEVHLKDVNGDKGGANDKRCMLEARLEGRQPIAVTHHADTVKQAVHGAVESMERAIETTLGRAADLARPRA